MTRAVAGATRTRSADCPSRVCGIGSGSSNSDVRARSDASAENVVSPTKRRAPRVSTGTTWAPPSTSRRQTSTALYAAIPPATPRTMRRPSSKTRRPGLVVAGPGPGVLVRLGALARAHHHDLVAGDLLERDRQRLAGDRGDLRRHDRAEPLAQLVEVRVDLTGALRAERDECELRPRSLEQLLDRGVHHRVFAVSHGGRAPLQPNVTGQPGYRARAGAGEIPARAARSAEARARRVGDALGQLVR